MKKTTHTLIVVGSGAVALVSQDLTTVKIEGKTPITRVCFYMDAQTWLTNNKPRGGMDKTGQFTVPLPFNSYTEADQ